MATLFPLEQSAISSISDEHGKAEAYIIKLINQLDKKTTKDWVFYYSFSFKSTSIEYNHKKYKDCEIDFLCLLPNLGIFVFEIKGGYIYKEKDQYFSVDSSNVVHKIKNPYEQAKSNYYALSKNLGEINFGNYKLDLSGLVGDHLVGFPNNKVIDFDDILKTDYNTFVGKDNLYNFFVRAAKEVRNSRTGIVPTVDDVKKIKEALLKENFTYKYDLNKFIDTVNVRVTMLTEEQKVVLRGLLDNKRCLIYGKAGTGKTVLSEMLFNHYINAKKDVIYFSYNDFNAEKVAENLKYREINSKSTSTPFLRYVVEEYIRLSGNDPIRKEKGTYDFTQMIDYLLNQTHRKEFKKYSALIIDEAQDITKKYGENDESNVLLLLDAITVGGLKDGEVFIFYDDGQNINNVRNPFYKDEIIEEARYAKFRLYKNCRNIDEIAEVVDTFKLREPIESLENTNIKVSNFNNIKNLTNAALSKIKELLNKGANKSSICILHTANNTETSPLPTIEKMFSESGLDIKKYSLKNSKDSITYTTNRKFKGLESDIVIYLRFESIKNDKYYDKQKLSTNVDYVTLSRAKSLCFIFNLISK